MPASVIVITYNGVDITNNVLFKSATFESQVNAIPGTFSFDVKDPNRTLSFVTGKSVGLTVDGVTLFGGVVTQIERTYAFPAVDTSQPVSTRIWKLHGVDWNVLFDRRVMRNTADYTHRLPNEPMHSLDGDLIETLAANYLDLPGDLDYTTLVENTTDLAPESEWLWEQQGTLWRRQMESMAYRSGAVWYINPDKKLVNRALENSESRWGFSDVPNNATLTSSPVAFQGATYGFREIDVTEDGSGVVSDAFIWGGSDFAGEIFFARKENASSIAQYGRWQYSELRFGQPLYKSQLGVDTRADIIVNGMPGATADEQNRGLRFAQWQIGLTWFAHDVPVLSSVKQHLRPGDLVTHVYYVLGQDNAHPLIQQLPLRRIRISFPNLDPNGDAYVRFEGSFSLQLNDPYTLWAYLLQNQGRISATTAAMSTATNASTTTGYGAFGQFEPSPTPDGSTTVFDLPNDFGYIAGTTQVFLNGILQRPGSEYEETDPAGGSITFFSAPFVGDQIWVVCRTVAG